MRPAVHAFAGSALVPALLLASVVALPASGDTDVTLPEVGDEGYLLTAIRGAEPERIPLRFLGTFENSLGPGHDLHLVQLEGLVAERLGVAAGMSGSPVYFDGELIGALSYRLGAMPREAVGAVTPLGDVLRAGTDRTARASGVAGISPIATPIHAGGLAAEIRGWLAQELEPRGFVVVVGGGSTPAPHELRPGAPVGIELARGDLSISATGTVTLLDGDTVYAFGHSFLGSGAIELPMVGAAIVHTLSDALGSTKLANTGEELGVFLDDRLSAIVGRRDGRARMIPLGVTLVREGDATRSSSFEVARAEPLTPLLVAALVASTVTSDVGFEAESTLLLEGTVAFDGLPPLELELAYAGGPSASPVLALARDVQAQLGRLGSNRFEPVRIERIDVRVRAKRGIEQYRLESVHYDRGPVRPGQRLTIRCRLGRYRADAITRELTLEIPPDLKGDRTVAVAIGPPSAVERALGDPALRRLRSAGDLETFVRALGESAPATRLVAVLYQSAAGVADGGELYRDLPPSAERLLGTTVGRNGATPTRVSVLARTDLTLDGPIEGGLVVRLQVETALGDSEAADR